MTLFERDRAALRQRWYEEGFYGRESFGELMRAGADRFPDATLQFVGGPHAGTFTLDRLWNDGSRVAGGLSDLGVGPGDPVAIWVPNWMEGAVATQAAAMLGAVIVPIIHIYGPREVGYILRQSEAKVLIMPAEWRTIDYLERFEAITGLDQLQHVVVIGDNPPDGMVPWERLLASRSLEQLPVADPDDVALLVYTSGTTADPKGVRHSTNTLAAEIRAGEMMGATDGHTAAVGLTAFPAGHIAGVLGILRLFLRGGTSIVMDAWDPELAARLVHEHGVGATAGAPFFLSTMLDAAEQHEHQLSSIRNYLVGAASVPAALVERADRAGIPVYRAYGSSEHPTISCGSPDDPIARRAGTDGRLTPGTEVRLLDIDDRDVPVGGEGEIVTRGPDQFIGYTDPALDADSFLPGGWFRTGDIGRLDADGYLTITDRKKDVIIRGGENIASKEVEDILSTHPAVAEVAAVGRPDERYGERVAVFVRLNGGAHLSLDEVCQHFVTSGAARQKTPEFLEVVCDLPRGMSGKVRKVELRDRLRSETA